MRIGMLLVNHPATRPSPIFPEVVRRLGERGAEVTAIYPDDQTTDLRTLRVEHDLYVLKAGTDTALSVAGALHALGARIVNPYPVSAMLRDKIVTSAVLERAGIPAPRAVVAAEPADLMPLLAEGPIVVKPYRGSQGRGVQIVRTADELAAVDAEPPLFAQTYLAPEGLDHKIYVIGDEVHGVERPWPPKTYEDKLGRPLQITREVRDIAARIAEAFGLSVFGFDVVMHHGEPYVIDISSFPGFKGVPDAAALLAGHIYSCAERELVAAGR